MVRVVFLILTYLGLLSRIVFVVDASSVQCRRKGDAKPVKRLSYLPIEILERITEFLEFEIASLVCHSNNIEWLEVSSRGVLLGLVRNNPSQRQRIVYFQYSHLRRNSWFEMNLHLLYDYFADFECKTFHSAMLQNYPEDYAIADRLVKLEEPGQMSLAPPQDGILVGAKGQDSFRISNEEMTTITIPVESMEPAWMLAFRQHFKKAIRLIRGLLVLLFGLGLDFAALDISLYRTSKIIIGFLLFRVIRRLSKGRVSNFPLRASPDIKVTSSIPTVGTDLRQTPLVGFEKKSSDGHTKAIGERDPSTDKWHVRFVQLPRTAPELGEIFNP